MKSLEKPNAAPRRDFISRRGFALGATGLLLVGCLEKNLGPVQERDWKESFNSIDKGGIRVDTVARRLIYWAPNNTAYREFPIGVPSSPELTRTGRTYVARKKAGPTWAPTPSMIRRNPKLPRFVPAGPDNPLGAYALYLGWKYYAIHGTNDPVTIGRPTTSGCFRLFATHIEWLFNAVSINTPVLVV